MGIFDFLKQFSNKVEEVKELRFGELIPWIDSLSDSLMEGNNVRLSDIKKKIDEEKNKSWS